MKPPIIPPMKPLFGIFNILVAIVALVIADALMILTLTTTPPFKSVVVIAVIVCLNVIFIKTIYASLETLKEINE